MKIRKINFKASVKDIFNYKKSFNMLIMIALAILFSASVQFPQDDPQNNDNLKDKKLDLLEKLENGKKVTSDDILASFGKNAGSDFILSDPDSPEFFDAPCLHSAPLLPGPFFYRFKKDIGKIKVEVIRPDRETGSNKSY
jgi:hypothetical protein